MATRAGVIREGRLLRFGASREFYERSNRRGLQSPHEAPVRKAAARGTVSTVPMCATEGRASFLAESPVGYRIPVEPDHNRRPLLFPESPLVSENVSLVIVSHSPDVARGAADMVRQMVGDEVKVAHCGGNPEGGLGTDVQKIMSAINEVWSPRGVAILVDLGGAETNSEMAIELLPQDRRARVVLCNSPIVEGAIMAATEASGGSSLAEVRATAEELSLR